MKELKWMMVKHANTEERIELCKEHNYEMLYNYNTMVTTINTIISELNNVITTLTNKDQEN